MAIIKCYHMSNKTGAEKFPLALSMSLHQWSWLSDGNQRFGLNVTAVRIANFMNFLLNLKLKAVDNQVSSLLSNL